MCTSIDSEDFPPLDDDCFLTTSSQGLTPSQLSTVVTNNSHNKTLSFSASSLSASSWIAISLGIAVFFVIAATLTIFCIKRRLYLKSSNNNEQADNTPSSRIYSTIEDAIIPHRKDVKIDAKNENAAGYLASSSKMTENILYSNFDSDTNENTAQTNHDTEESSAKNNLSMMTVNTLYDGCQFQLQADGVQDKAKSDSGINEKCNSAYEYVI